MSFPDSVNMTSNNEMAEFNSESVKIIRICCVYKLLDNGIGLERNESMGIRLECLV